MLLVKSNELKSLNNVRLLLIGAMASTPVWAQGPTLSGSIVSMLLSLIVVIAIIVLCAGLLKKTNLAMGKSKGMSVVSILPIGTREKLVVVEVADKQLLLGVTSQNVSLIKELDEKLSMPSQASFGDSFQQIIKQQKRNNNEN